MTDYTKATDFAAKDALPSGDADKVIKGTEFETEFDAIVTAIATKADSASPTFTGTVALPSSVSIGGTSVTSTAAELNVLDGVTAFIDDDSMATASATNIPSGESVKAYADSLNVTPVTGRYTTTASSGTHAITGIGFQPSLVVLHASAFSTGSYVSSSTGSFDGTDHNVITNSIDSGTSTNTYSGDNGVFVYDVSNPTASSRSAGTMAINSDGFTLTKSNYDVAVDLLYICYP